MSAPSTLPLPRRIVTWHDESGECVATEGTVPMEPSVDGVLQGARVFVQSDFPAKPDKTPVYASQSMQGYVHSGGVAVYFVDFKPQHHGPFHYSNSMDYVVVTHGSLELETTNGQSWSISTGDVVVNAANVHYWHNRTDQWARMFCVLSPSEEVRISGKNLKELYPDIFAVPTLQ